MKGRAVEVPAGTPENRPLGGSRLPSTSTYPARLRVQPGDVVLAVCAVFAVVWMAVFNLWWLGLPVAAVILLVVLSGGRTERKN